MSTAHARPRTANQAYYIHLGSSGGKGRLVEKRWSKRGDFRSLQRSEEPPDFIKLSSVQNRFLGAKGDHARNDTRRSQSSEPTGKEMVWPVVFTLMESRLPAVA